MFTSQSQCLVRFGLSTAVTVLVTAFTLAASAPGAGAVSVVRCTGTSSVTYSPGLTDTPTPTTAALDDALGPCASALPLWTGSATVSRTIPLGEASCLDLLGSASSTKVLNWSDATSSAFTFNAIANSIRGQIVVNEIGTISAGRYRSSTALGTIVRPADLTACSTPAGLTRVTGIYTLDILL